MPLETVFAIANGAATVSWLPLALTPSSWCWPNRVARIVAGLLAALYVGLILSFWSRGEGGYGSLSDVASLFETRGLLLAGWVHYLVFDLLLGSWEREEAARIGLRPWALVPCLFLTFMFGPTGWLAFLGVRRYKKGAPS